MTEPLAVAFANTRHAVRGRELEGLGTPTELSKWLDEHGLPAPAAEAAAVPDFLALRDAIRSLLRATTQGEPLASADRETVNAAAGQAPRWPMLVGTADSGYRVIEMTAADPLPAALAEIARDAIALLGGPQREAARACEAPGCVQFFVKDHPRREYCSAGCGNRARAARHYTKVKASS